MIHEEARLNRYLTKKDFKLLVDTAFISLKSKEADPLKAAFRKLQDLIPFEYGFIVRSDMFPGKEMKLDFNFLFLHEAARRDYLRDDLYKRDPVARELYRTRRIIDIPEFYKRNPVLRSNPVTQLFFDYRLKSGLTDMADDYSNQATTSLALFRLSGRIDQRVKIITQCMLPFFSVIYNKACDQTKKTKRSNNLTVQETEVLKWLVQGKTSWEISMILNISERTVNFHVANLMRKLNATKRMQAVAVALSRGIIEL